MPKNVQRSLNIVCIYKPHCLAAAARGGAEPRAPAAGRKPKAIDILLP